MIKSERFAVEAAPLPADNNIRYQYPIHEGKWVWHPDAMGDEMSFCRFSLAFELDAAVTITLHVSADQRFELYCDETYVGMGPDRSDIEHYSFHAYRLELEAGPHELVAEVYFLGTTPTNRPWAQATIKPGFVLYSDDAPVDLNTGSAAWQVSRRRGVSTATRNLKSFFVVGPDYTYDASAYFDLPPAVDVAVVQAAGRNNHSGTMQPGWKLYPSRMPEQTREPFAGGRIRCVTDVAADDPYPTDPTPPDAIAAWQAFIDGQSPVTVPANTRVNVLWDLDNYHTAYHELTTTGGAGASVALEWAESCYTHPLPEERADAVQHAKGNRDEYAGKYFRGNGDTFLPDGETRTFRSPWWRAGRYVRITVETAAEPVTLERVTMLETRMPVENDSVFTSSDAELGPVIDIATRGIQMCAHETYMDCPYYEQMMYVGDTRIQMLTAYVMSAEDRLNQRALEIFDWSRHETGFVLERCPSQPKQLSCTFAMVWVWMLRDFGWWRDDAAFLRRRLKGMRCMLEEFKALPDDYTPLLPALPGWSFMDWVGPLSFVNNPGPNASVASVPNLLFLNALNAAADLEEAYGEPHLAEYNRQWAKRIAAAIDQRFWDESRGLFADTPDHQQWSEHAQCLALLSGHFPQHEQRCFASLITAEDLHRTTVYFSYYLLETFAKFGRPDLIQAKLEFWKAMVANGQKTPVEMPEPTRSDCHAWSSHPLFHMHASLAGIRPDAPGFARVSVTPQPGSLTQLASTIPHPRGTVSVAMSLTGDTWDARIDLPAGVPGTLHWRGDTYPLEGTVTHSLPG